MKVLVHHRYSRSWDILKDSKGFLGLKVFLSTGLDETGTPGQAEPLPMPPCQRPARDLQCYHQAVVFFMSFQFLLKMDGCCTHMLHV